MRGDISFMFVLSVICIYLLITKKNLKQENANLKLKQGALIWTEEVDGKARVFKKVDVTDKVIADSVETVTRWIDQ